MLGWSVFVTVPSLLGIVTQQYSKTAKAAVPQMDN